MKECVGHSLRTILGVKRYYFTIYAFLLKFHLLACIGIYSTGFYRGKYCPVELMSKYEREGYG